MDPLANLSDAGKQQFSKMNDKLIALRQRVEQETDIFNKAPSDKLQRARSSVEYHSRMVREHADVLERRLAAVREQCAKDLEMKEKYLREAEEKLRIQETIKPRNLIRAEQELDIHLEKMKRTFLLPDTFYDSPIVIPAPSESPEELELKALRKAAEEEKKKRLLQEQQEEQKRLEKKQKDKEMYDYYVQQHKKQEQQIISSNTSQLSTTDPKDDWDSEDDRETDRKLQELKEARELKKKFPPLDELPPPKPKKQIKKSSSRGVEKTLGPGVVTYPLPAIPDDD